MADALREATKMRKNYGWKTYIIKFDNYYSYTFDPTLFPEFKLIGEVGEDGELIPKS